MAVQKSRKTRSKRGMHRAHAALSGPTLATDNTTGEIHRRHHITADGYYRGKQIIVKKAKSQEAEAETSDQNN
jgi:large subunit ribosomal protein L32